MFYTKYRPQKFSEVSKPNQTAEILAKQISTHKTVHAYLFIGPRGTGKTTTARILAKALNCESVDKNGDPCNTCEICESVTKGSFIDLIEIDAASNRGIDDIRELKDRVKLAPSRGKTKVYIIDEVHMLTNEAFNALLKTLEEPPKRTVFILCTTEVHKVPDTIKSRCQIFKFKRATINQLTEKLAKIAKEEGASITKKDLEKVASASLGGFRDAETLLQQIIEGEVSVDALMSLSPRETIHDFIDNLMQNDVSHCFEKINQIYEDGVDLYVWTGELLKYFRDMLFVKSGSSATLVDLTEDLFKQITDQSNKVEINWLKNSLEIFSTAINKVKGSYIPQLPLELAVVEIINGDDVIVVNDKPVKPFGEPNSKPTSTEKKVDITDVIIQPEASVNFIELESKWTDILTKTKDINSSLVALLKAAKPKGVENNKVVLEVYFAFHKERLESSKNRKIVEEVLFQVLGVSVGIKCELCAERPKHLRKGETGVLTDINIVPAQVTDTGVILKAFDGELPL